MLDAARVVRAQKQLIAEPARSLLCATAGRQKQTDSEDGDQHHRGHDAPDDAEQREPMLSFFAPLSLSLDTRAQARVKKRGRGCHLRFMLIHGRGANDFTTHTIEPRVRSTVSLFQVHPLLSVSWPESVGFPASIFENARAPLAVTEIFSAHGASLRVHDAREL